MECKKCCCFLCECVLHVLCLIQMALIYLFLVLFVFYSLEYTEYKKKRQKERKRIVFEKKEASVFYLFSFILASNLEKRRRNRSRCDSLARHFGVFFSIFSGFVRKCKYGTTLKQSRKQRSVHILFQNTFLRLFFFCIVSIPSA